MDMTRSEQRTLQRELEHLKRRYLDEMKRLDEICAGIYSLCQICGFEMDRCEMDRYPCAFLCPDCRVAYNTTFPTRHELYAFFDSADEAGH